jgi:prepilin-type N-terminal cleavage/methylation domain-containing protein
MNALACTKPSPAKRAFSLLEMLVAMAILSLMMVFLFNLVAQTMRAWEGGSKQVEAAQAARIGLEKMAQDLQFALGGSATAPPLTASATGKTNFIPFFSTNNAIQTLGVPASLPLSPSSGQIFAVAPVAEEKNELYELGYMSIFVTAAQGGEGYNTMRGRRYFLLRHAVPGTNNAATGRGDFFYANTAPNNQWLTENVQAISDGNQPRRLPLIQNCYQLKFQYASNNNGVLSFSDQWTAGDRLPAGVSVTAKVMDEKTAARIASLRPNGLTAADVADGATSDVARILREGTVEVHRFIPFINARP